MPRVRQTYLWKGVVFEFVGTIYRCMVVKGQFHSLQDQSVQERPCLSFFFVVCVCVRVGGDLKAGLDFFKVEIKIPQTFTFLNCLLMSCCLRYKVHLRGSRVKSS